MKLYNQNKTAMLHVLFSKCSVALNPKPFPYVTIYNSGCAAFKTSSCIFVIDHAHKMYTKIVI